MSAKEEEEELAAGFLHERTAQRWIDEVYPLAAQLVDPSGGTDVRIRAHQVESLAEAPYGSLMLTWPQQNGHEALINHLVDCRDFLGLYDLMLRDLPDEHGYRRVLADGTRLQVAVTNDVLQILAPGPSGSYSMIRHHALMFFAAHQWLPAAERARWDSLYHASVTPAVSGYRASNHAPGVRSYLDRLERSAFAALERLADAPRRAGVTQFDRSEDDVRVVLSYLHAANAAVAVLIDAHKAVAPSDRHGWLVDQLSQAYRTDDFLVDQLRATIDR